MKGGMQLEFPNYRRPFTGREIIEILSLALSLCGDIDPPVIKWEPLCELYTKRSKSSITKVFECYHIKRKEFRALLEFGRKYKEDMELYDPSLTAFLNAYHTEIPIQKAVTIENCAKLKKKEIHYKERMEREFHKNTTDVGDSLNDLLRKIDRERNIHSQNSQNMQMESVQEESEAGSAVSGVSGVSGASGVWNKGTVICDSIERIVNEKKRMSMGGNRGCNMGTHTGDIKMESGDVKVEGEDTLGSGGMQQDLQEEERRHEVYITHFKHNVREVINSIWDGTQREDIYSGIKDLITQVIRNEQMAIIAQLFLLDVSDVILLYTKLGSNMNNVLVFLNRQLKDLKS